MTEREQVEVLSERVCARLADRPFGTPILLVDKLMLSEVAAVIQERNPALAAYFRQRLEEDSEEVGREELMKVSDELEMIELSRWIAGNPSLVQ